MKRCLSLLRWKNLLMVALTQSIVWCALPVDNPAVGYRILLVLSTVLVTAGGYLINDWYDVEIDLINKPQKTFLHTVEQKKQARVAWIALSFLGLLLAIPPAVEAGMPVLLLLQLVTVLLLWWYAKKGKQLPVVGNVLVALLTALSVELPQFYIGHFNAVVVDFLAVFALLLTWIREIVKDLQDEVGDRAGGCKTLPILAGRGVSLALASLLGGVTLGAVLVIATIVFFVPYTYWGSIVGVLLLLGIATPLFVWMRRLWHCRTPADYKKSSTLLKAIMGSGILIFVIFLLAFFDSLSFP